MPEVLVCCWLKSVADPDLQIRGEGGSHPDPEIRGGEGAVSKSPGPPGPSLDLPLELTLADILYMVINLLCFLL